MPIHPDFLQEGDLFLACARVRFSPKYRASILRQACAVHRQSLREDETEEPRLLNVGRRQLMDELPPDEKQQLDRIRSGERPDPEVLEAAVEESIERQNQARVVFTVHRRGGSWNRGKRVKKIRVDETVYLKCSRSNHAGDELNGLPSCAEFPAPEAEVDG